MIITLHESNQMPANTFTTGGGETGQSWNYTWVIFAVIIVFFALIFLRRDRNDGNNDYNGLIPALALGGLGGYNRGGNCGCNNDCCDMHTWDVERDMMREFADTKMQAKDTAWTLSRDSDRYHYEQRAAIDRNDYHTAIGFKESEILGLKNTSEVVNRIDQLEKRMDQEIIAKQREELNTLKTVWQVRGWGPVPAYNVCPPQSCGFGGYGYA